MGSSDKGLNGDSAILSNGYTQKIDSDSETETDEEVPSPLPGSIHFEEGETVLAFHSERIYPAKVIKVEYRENKWQYRLHYTGWKKRWDEWVGVDRLLKCNDENVRKQKAQNELLTQKNAKPGGRSMHCKQKAPGKRNRVNGLLAKDNDAASHNKSVDLHMPRTLRKQLVDDCEFITHLGKLVKLPRNPCVNDILSKYRDYRLEKDGMITDSVEEILKGLRSYFDEALPVMLLYKSERQQFDGAIKEGISPSTVYGAEHLLRLFVKLPELLASANIDEETLVELQQRLVHFLKFLKNNQSVFFLSTYHVIEGADD